MRLDEIMSRLTTAACGDDVDRSRRQLIDSVMKPDEKERLKGDCPRVTEEVFAPMEEWVRGRPDRLRGLIGHILAGVPLADLADGMVEVERRLAVKSMMN